MAHLIKEAWNDALGVITLDKKRIKKASKEDCTNVLLVFFIVATVHAFASILWLNRDPVDAFVNTLLGLLIGSFIWFYVIWLFGRGFGSRVDYTTHYKPMADTLILHALIPLPMIGFLAALWGVVVRIIIMKELHGLSKGKAAASVLIPLAILIILTLSLDARGEAELVTLITKYILFSL